MCCILEGRSCYPLSRERTGEKQAWFTEGGQAVDRKTLVSYIFRFRYPSGNGMESVEYTNVEFRGELSIGGRTSTVICINCILSEEIWE